MVKGDQWGWLVDGCGMRERVKDDMALGPE